MKPLAHAAATYLAQPIPSHPPLEEDERALTFAIQTARGLEAQRMVWRFRGPHGGVQARAAIEVRQLREECQREYWEIGEQRGLTGTIWATRIA